MVIRSKIIVRKHKRTRDMKVMRDILKVRCGVPPWVGRAVASASPELRPCVVGAMKGGVAQAVGEQASEVR